MLFAIGCHETKGVGPLLCKGGLTDLHSNLHTNVQEGEYLTFLLLASKVR